MKQISGPLLRYFHRNFAIISKYFRIVALSVLYLHHKCSAAVIPSVTSTFLQNPTAVKAVCIIVIVRWARHVLQWPPSLTMFLKTSKEPLTAFICSLSPIGLSFLNRIIVSKTLRDAHAGHRTSMTGFFWAQKHPSGFLLALWTAKINSFLQFIYLCICHLHLHFKYLCLFSLFCCWWLLSFLNLLWYLALTRVYYRSLTFWKSVPVLLCSLRSLVRTENTLLENTGFFWLPRPEKKGERLHQASRRRSTQTGHVDLTVHNKRILRSPAGQHRPRRRRLINFRCFFNPYLRNKRS